MKEILAGIIGGITFIIFLILLKINFIWAICTGVGGYLGTILLFPTKKSLEVELNLQGVSMEDVQRIISEGNQKIKTIRFYSIKINNSNVRKKIEEICSVADKIIEDLRVDPKDVKAARKFFTYYLDATTRIIQRYVELSGHGLNSAELIKALQKVEDLLDTIKQTFESQLEKLLEDDLFDLETELKLLENTIKSEGL